MISAKVVTGRTNSGRMEKRNYFDWKSKRMNYLNGQRQQGCGRRRIAVEKDCGRHRWELRSGLT